MKPLTVLGALLILAGGYVLLRGFSYTSSRDTLEVGPLSATVTQKESIPTWAGGLAVGAGLVMIVAGAGSRKRS